MNPTTSVDNDLQKAIDDITKSTSSDPLFADPVAAPAPAPAVPPAPVGPFPVATPAPMPTAPAPMPMPEPVAPAEPVSAPIEDIEPTPIVHEEEVVADQVEPVEKSPFMGSSSMGINQVKEAALREVAPLLSKLDIPAKQKFDLYKNVIDNYHDSSVIAPAYQAASEIEDERDRGEALLYIIDSIDNM